MPYNSVISRSDAAALIPEEVSAEILKHVPEQSSVLQLARRLPNMSRAQRRMPVMSALASAYFVNGETGLKQTTEVSWENKYIDAEELAAIVPIPEAVLDDASYDIWGEVRPSIEEALGQVIDTAVEFGTNIPSTWTTNLGTAGLLAGAVAASQTVDLSTIESTGDLYDAIMGTSGVIAKVEEDGFWVNGHIAALSMRAKLRGLREKVYNGSSLSALGQPIFQASMQQAGQYVLDGQPIKFPRNGSMDASSALMFSGDWQQLVYAMRQDITYKILSEAVIQDAGGNIIYNLAQQDMVALRVVMRLGFALPNPINRVNTSAVTRYPFAVLIP